MIALLAAYCLLGTPGIQGKALLEQVVPRPTGKNGYEEYLRAAQIVTGGDASLYINWSLGMGAIWEADPDDSDSVRRLALAKRLDKMSVLEVRREALAKYGEALTWVKQGNSKPVFDPRQNVDLLTLFPEFASFKTVVKFARIAAYVYDADGNSTKATDTLLDALALSGNISSSTLISYLVGIASQAIVLASFESRMDRLSATDATRVINALSQHLARPPAVLGAIRGEARFMTGSTDEILKASSEDLELMGLHTGALGKLNASQRVELVRSLKAKLNTHYEGVLTRFQGPESEWIFEEPEAPETVGEPASASELAEFLYGQLTPVFSQMGVAAAKERTQLRLLRIACRIVQFRWEHERLPSTLEDAVPPSEIPDPLTGERFQYTPMSDRFRVFSKGVPATGEIDIKYVRSRTDSAPPPPKVRPGFNLRSDPVIACR